VLLQIEPFSSNPIYEQLIWEIKRGIATKQLVAGESLPSVRSLASDIGINLHTVNKVYKHLEAEGILEKNKNGFSVSRVDPLKPTPQTQAQLRQLVKELTIEKNLYRLTEAELMALFKEVEEELTC